MSRLTADEWQRVLPLLKNIKPERREAARRRLVEGVTLVDAGAPFGYSKADVSYIVRLVMRWWEKLDAMPEKPRPPPGWVHVELMVPRRHVDEVRRVVAALYPPPEPLAARKLRAASKSAAVKPSRRSSS